MPKPTPAEPPPEPAKRMHRYQCPNVDCRHRFSRQTRVGIWSKCPKCGTRAYGPAVLKQLAATGAASVLPKERVAKPAPTKPAPAVEVRPAAAPAPLRAESSMWERIVGAGDL